MLRKILRLIRNSFRNVSETYREVYSMKFFNRRSLLEEKILNSKEMGITNHQYCDSEIIVSLTTYGRRIYDVCFTIESLMQQTFKANKIILWLDEETMKKTLPESLSKQIKRGLTIMQTKDIRSYKKLIPALSIFPNANIITVDDDLIYDFDIIERLVKAHLEDPLSIHSCRIHSMTFDSNNKLKSYEDWNWCKASSSKRNFITGGGGTLYPPRSLAAEVLNEEAFTSLCPTADDVWFTAMAKLKGTPIKKVETRSVIGEDYVYNIDVQDMGLLNINVGKKGKNNEQIEAVFSRYNIFELIR